MLQCPGESKRIQVFPYVIQAHYEIYSCAVSIFQSWIQHPSYPPCQVPHLIMMAAWSIYTFYEYSWPVFIVNTINPLIHQGTFGLLTVVDGATRHCITVYSQVMTYCTLRTLPLHMLLKKYTMCLYMTHVCYKSLSYNLGVIIKAWKVQLAIS